MRILICSDGMPASAAATRLGGIISKACKAQTFLLGIVETQPDESALRQALEREAQQLRYDSVEPKIILRAGEPIREIVNETSSNTYDLVIIGTDYSGLHGRSQKTYEVIKAISHRFWSL